jgi:hypothetical protein
MEHEMYLQTFEAMQSYLFHRFQNLRRLVQDYTSNAPSSLSPISRVPISTSSVSTTMDALNRSSSESSYEIYLAVVEIPRSKRIPSHIAPSKPTTHTKSTSPTASAPTVSYAQINPVKNTIPSHFPHSLTQFHNETSSTGTSAHPTAAAAAGVIVAGYAVAALNKSTGRIIVLDLILRVPTAQNGTLERDLLKALWKRCQDDVGNHMLDDAGNNGGLIGIPGSSKGEKGRKLNMKNARNGRGGDGGWSFWMLVEKSLNKWTLQWSKIGFVEQPAISKIRKGENDNHQDDVESEYSAMKGGPGGDAKSTGRKVVESDCSDGVCRIMDALMKTRKESVWMSLKAQKMLE